MERTLHIPVMMQEALDALHLQRGMTVVDATLGGGGYTSASHQMVMPGGRIIAIDQDYQALERFRAGGTGCDDGITLVHSNYSAVRKVLAEMGISKVDAIVADLGLSSDQLERAERGFSFLVDGPLDMRMNQGDSFSARIIVNEWCEKDLIEILRVYGDERHARRVADAIICNRPFKTTKVLAQVIVGAVGRFYRDAKIHPATRTFQAIRIATNDEYTHVKTFLTDGIDLLRPAGRMSVVSFHSGEDRIVKNIFRMQARGCLCADDAPICQCGHEAQVRLVTRKAVTPSMTEVRGNPRARSARLRVIEKR